MKERNAQYAKSFREREKQRVAALEHDLLSARARCAALELEFGHVKVSALLLVHLGSQ